MGELFILIPILTLLAIFVAMPVILFVRMASLRQRIVRLEQELARLGGSPAPAGEAAAAAVVPAVPAIAMAPPPSGAPPTAALPGAGPPGAAPPTAAPASVAAPTAAPANAAAPTAAPPPARPALDVSNLEQLVGGVWLQNLGSIVLLLGVFLMIVWGYTTGRLGPQVLVAGGVAFGLALLWRGDRVARRTPRFGHALIGVGLGVVYLSLDLGFLRLHVLSAWVALVLLVLVSFGAVVAGLRYRVQAIAVFGVIGAFLPQLGARWLGLQGFETTPAFLLGYLAAVDLVVFALAARAGWSRLDLLAIGLSAITWLAMFHRPAWGWGVQIGLSGLFTVLGLAPLPRLVRVEGRVRNADLAVVAAAPLAMLLASSQFLAWVARGPAALLLLSLAVVMLAAALWVDARRPERDLWMPLTAAATLFAAAGLERGLGPDTTAVAWALEGGALLLLGLRERGGWLRAMGHVVLACSAVMLLARLDAAGWSRDSWPFVRGEALRDLACMLVLLVTGAVLGRGRARLDSLERLAPEAWTVAGHALLALWLWNESQHLARWLVEGGGPFAPGPPPPGVSPLERRTALAAGLAAAGWLWQAALLAWRGPASAGLRRLAAAALGFAALFVVFTRGDNGGWTDQAPFVHPVALLQLAAVGLMMILALRHAPRRGEGGRLDRFSARGWFVAAGLALMLWSARETHLLAIALARPGDPAVGPLAGALPQRARALAATLASVAWLAQAVATLVVGWRRDSAFLRWSGLALMGLTLLKFVFYDLQTVDVFWRFLTAIVVGAAMLAFSYAYQRRAKATKADA